jgi:hypothetical protein
MTHPLTTKLPLFLLQIIIIIDKNISNINNANFIKKQKQKTPSKYIIVNQINFFLFTSFIHRFNLKK